MLQDVRTLQKEDRMDSFMLSETIKYLYLLFAEESDLFLDVDSFVFTTEAHLLPLTLARLSNRTAMPVGLRQNFFPFNQCQINLNFQLKEGQRDDPVDEDVEYANSCPSTIFLFPNDKVSEY